MPLPMPLEPPTTSTCLLLKSSSFIARDPSLLICWALVQAFAEIIDHQDMIVISPVLLETPLFIAVLDEARGAVKPARIVILAYHGQLNHLDAFACMVENRRNKLLPKPQISCGVSHVHAPKRRLMRLLRTFLRSIGRDARERPIEESAEDVGAAKHGFEPRQRLRVFLLKRAAECFGTYPKTFQPDLSVQGSIRRLQAADLQAAISGHVCISLGSFDLSADRCQP